jgi:hypothetical protein
MIQRLTFLTLICRPYDCQKLHCLVAIPLPDFHIQILFLLAAYESYTISLFRRLKQDTFLRMSVVGIKETTAQSEHKSSIRLTNDNWCSGNLRNSIVRCVCWDCLSWGKSMSNKYCLSLTYFLFVCEACLPIGRIRVARFYRSCHLLQLSARKGNLGRTITFWILNMSALVRMANASTWAQAPAFLSQCIFGLNS